MSSRDEYREEDDSWMSVLDRLVCKPASMDHDGARSRDPLRDSITRDVAELLSARREDDAVPREYEEASRSILNFGMPEISSFNNLSSPLEQNRFCKTMEETIRAFEPRLSKVVMRVVDAGDRKGVLRFHLEGHIVEYGERYVFDFDMTSDTGLVFVAGSGS